MSISIDFGAIRALEMCLADQNRQKIFLKIYFSVHGHPRSLLSAPVKSSCTTYISDD